LKYQNIEIPDQNNYLKQKNRSVSLHGQLDPYFGVQNNTISRIVSGVEIIMIVCINTNVHSHIA
jgi:hypothetical protein